MLESLRSSLQRDHGRRDLSGARVDRLLRRLWPHIHVATCLQGATISRP